MGSYESISFVRSVGSYDWCHPNNKQAQYIFHFNSFSDEAAKYDFGETCGGFNLPLENDNDRKFCDGELDALVDDLASYYEGWAGSTPDKVRRLSCLLDSINDENEKLFAKDMINKCDEDIDEINKKKMKYEKLLASYNE